MKASPLVSVVIATYNRADILPYAIRSALLDKGVDLEIIVVGDCCTDTTERVVCDIADSRVRFVNLSENWGEQSVPSNKGIELARGEFIAFLNHDDLFLPGHLSDLLAAHREGADVTWCPYVVARPVPHRPGAVARTYELGGVTATEDFDPAVFIVSSATCYRKSVLEKIGGWTRASETALFPSQDLLFKAHKAGFKMTRTDMPSLLVLYSGRRYKSYTQPVADEHQWYFELIQNGGETLLAELLRAGVHEAARTRRDYAETSAFHFAAWRLQRRVGLLARHFGFHPNALRNWLQFARAGGPVNVVRRGTGLPRVDFRSQTKLRARSDDE
jgi:glycosyltransferase involved in cell wall biosynthesis